MANSLLMSLLNLTAAQFGALPADTRNVLRAVLYDQWSRDEDVEAAWLETLSGAHPHGALTDIRATLRSAVLEAAQVLHVPPGKAGAR